MTRCRLHQTENCAICIAAGAYAPSGAPMVNGKRVSERTYVEYERICGVWRLTRETFDRVEDGVLREALEAGDSARELGYRLDVQHVIDVRGSDPEQWIYQVHGLSEPGSTSRTNVLGGIPPAGLKESAIDAYLRVRITGEPVYDLVQYQPGKRYRRLLWPVSDERGYVRSVINSILMEPVKRAVA